MQYGIIFSVKLDASTWCTNYTIIFVLATIHHGFNLVQKGVALIGFNYYGLSVQYFYSVCLFHIEIVGLQMKAYW